MDDPDLDLDLNLDTPDAFLLTSWSDRHHKGLPANSKMVHMGLLRAYWLGCVVCVGGFLFGYDSGIVGEIQNALGFDFSC